MSAAMDSDIDWVPNRQERREVRRGVWYYGRWILGVTVVVVVLVGAGALVWQRYYGRSSLDTNARNRRASFERQDTDRKLILTLWSQYTATAPDDTAHREALMARMCATYGEVRGSLGDYPTIANALADCP